jgi:hypothetical protein
MNKQALSRDKAKEKNTQGFDQRIHEFAPVLLAALVGERFSRDDSAWKNWPRRTTPVWSESGAPWSHVERDPLSTT